MSYFYKMYFILVISTLVAYTQQQLRDPAFMETYHKYETECAKEVGLEENYVKNIWKDNHFPNDPKLKCYFKCTSLKFGMLTTDGKIVTEALKNVEIQFNDAATDREIVEECGNISGSDLCDTAYKLVGCIKAAQLD